MHAGGMAREGVGMSRPPGNDDDLVQRLESGDPQALADAFALHRQRLACLVRFRLAPRLQGRLDADDVLQEAYLAAARRIAHFGRTESPSPFVWLRMIVMQTLVDLYRQHLGAKMRDGGREVPIQEVGYPDATSASMAISLAAQLTSPSQAAVRAERMDRVRQAIETMDPIDREVLALRHFEELTNQEAAEVLGIQPKAASIRYVRALRRLKALVAELPAFQDETRDA